MTSQERVIHSLESCPKNAKPAILTIGNFDGVHRGHQAVIERAHQIAEQQHAPLTVLTFSNHPASVLKPDLRLIPLCTNAYRYHLLAQCHADLIVAITFTRAFANQSAEEFLHSVNKHLPFSHLILGYDACIGKDRQGNREQVEAIANRWGFTLEYLEAQRLDDDIISSTRIRNLLQQGSLDEATHLLGRRPSYFGAATPGQGLGRTMGFPTLNLDVTGLCLPPYGVYAITANTPSGPHRGVANLGTAPTIRSDERILLEAFLFDCHQDIPPGDVEVFLHTFLRPEQKFANIDALKAQIACDVEAAQRQGFSSIRIEIEKGC